MEQSSPSSRRKKLAENKILASTLKDSKWVIKEWETLKEKYGDKFVAVLDCRVIAHHEDISRLMKIVDAKVPDKKSYVTTEFINLKELRWIR
jgi:hypothetical protein